MHARFLRSDFRTRKYRGGYRVWQLVGKRWEPLYYDVYPTRQAANAFIDSVVDAQ